MKATKNDLKRIKLVIWDLDETFWNGTLSDNTIGSSISPIAENISLVKNLTDRGIVNAICSKNNKEDAEQELQKLGILDYFVFNSINWEPKGNRIKTLVSNMSLRSANVLFIDDNNSNLNEAEFVTPDILTATPDFISTIIENVCELGKDDKEHSRLHQYKILETKRKDEATSSSNLEFLRASEIKLYIKTSDLLNDIDRIEELIQRSNQLNFTKQRTPVEELQQVLKDRTCNCGCVYVSDKYGVYGMVGFYAIKNNICEHFLFSCRTMGMGIEQYVYSYLGCPQLTIVGDVSGSICQDTRLPDYIQNVDSLDSFTAKKKSTNHKLRILMKGPCDLEVMRTYLLDGDYEITAEFNFVDKRGNQADFYNHTSQIVNALLPDDIICKVCKCYNFISEEAFVTSLFTTSYDIVCISPLMDATLSTYRSTTNSITIPFGLYNCKITEPKNWIKYIENEVMTAHSHFCEKELSDFAKNFSNVDFSADSTCKNLEVILSKIRSLNPNVKLVVMLLPELAYHYAPDEDVNAFSGKEIMHRQLNEAIRNKFNGREGVYLLDVNKYIKNQSDYFDSINHFSKVVYFKLADEFSKYVGSFGYSVKTKSYLVAYLRNIARNLYKRYILHSGKLEVYVQRVNHFFRGK